ncbi:MAG: hypothetical protein WCA64_02255 [Gallionella sp.]
MNEEQAIFEFFSLAENLPLALSVAEQMDKLRERMNNRFWQELRARLDTLIKEHQLAWHIEFTEDKTSPECLVGLHCTLNGGQTLYLRPMMEQQYSGGDWRIYFGLIWSAALGQSGLAAAIDLKATLQKAGFKSNESFLAWQWTAFHPRSKDFLLRYARQPEQLLQEVVTKFSTLLIDYRVEIAQANEMLSTAATRSLSASLEQLRDELLD